MITFLKLIAQNHYLFPKGLFIIMEIPLLLKRQLPIEIYQQLWKLFDNETSQSRFFPKVHLLFHEFFNCLATQTLYVLYFSRLHSNARKLPLLYNTHKKYIVRDFHLDSEFCPLKNFTLTKDLGQVYTSHHRYEDCEAAVALDT